MSNLTMEEQPGGGYRVCLKEDGIEVCCYCDSMHVAYGKERYLKEAIARQARSAFDAA